MNRVSFAAAAAAVAALTLAGEAGATVSVLTFTGTVASGRDTLGFFGGGDLAGMAFATTFTIDDAVTHITTTLAGDTEMTGNIEGSTTINGRSIAGGSTDHFSLVEVFPNYIYAQTGNAQLGFEFAIEPASNPFAGIGFTTPLATYTLKPGDSSVAHVDTYSPTFQHYGFSLITTTVTYSILPDQVETTPTVGVPEPATWALMIAGFAGVGGLLRRRRSALPA